MFGNAATYQQNVEPVDVITSKQLKQEPLDITACIPKVEPRSRSNSNEDLSNINGLMVSPIPYTTPYKLKDPIILLERCDKIWETLKLIKNLQSNTKESVAYDRSGNNQQSIHGQKNKQGMVQMMKKSTTRSVSLTESRPSYIKYQPILGDNSTSLPNFKLSVKTTKKLHHCQICGKQYIENRSLRIHSNNVHGVYIPPKRRVAKLDEKDVQERKKVLNMEKQNDNNDILSLKKNDKERAVDIHPLVSSSMESQKVNVNTQPQRRKRSCLLQSNDALDVNNISKNKLKSDIPPEAPPEQQNTNSHPPAPVKLQLPDVVKCVLCSRRVRNVRKHFREYHKIGCSSRILREFGQSLFSEETSTPDTDSGEIHPEKESDKIKEKHDQNQIEEEKHDQNQIEEKKHDQNQIEEEKHDQNQIEEEKHDQNQIEEEKHDQDQIALSQSEEKMDIRHDQMPNGKRQLEASLTDPNKKRKLNKNDVSLALAKTESSKNSTCPKDKVFQCDVCLGVYSCYNALWAHKRSHRIRGETKENFHMFKCRYLKSPFCTKDKSVKNNANLVTVTSSIDNEDDTNEHNTQGSVEEGSNGFDDLAKSDTSKKDGEDSDTICACGRLFRNPHTFFVHRTNCRVQSDEEAQDNTADSTDRDSGSGINITIKKRNDSYEIVGRDSGDENKPQDSGHSKDSNLSCDASKYNCEDQNNVPTNVKDFELLESSKYSKDHSFLKLQIVDEDIDVDIEEDSQLSLNSRERNGKLVIKSENDLQKGTENEFKENDQKLMVNKVPSLKILCQKILNKKV